MPADRAAPGPALRDVLRRATRLEGDEPPSGAADDARAITPGGVLVYGDGGVEHTLAFGRSQVVPAGAAFEVTPQTVYDLASLTKPIATAGALMRLAEAAVDVDAPARALLPELAGDGKDRITLRQLLGHASGFPAHIEFFRALLRGERRGAATRRDALLRMVVETPLAYEPGAQTIYSDLGYILLGVAIERATGQRLDDAVRALVTEPLGMRDTYFVDLDVPAADRPRAAGRVAPTELCPYRGLVRAEVHDDNAHAAGGICGHAGLFATAADVARFARAILAALADDARGAAPLSPDVVRLFASSGAAPDTTWRLGWDRPSPPPVVSQFGDGWPRDGIGHTGFTGTAVWLDPRHHRYAVLLTNRVHPSRDNPGIRALRRAVCDAVQVLLSGAPAPV